MLNMSNVIYKHSLKHNEIYKTCRNKKPTGILKLGYVHFAEA